MEQLRLGIIGFGNMGTGHARNILDGKCPEVRLCAVADNDPARRTALAAFPGAENVVGYGDAELMIHSGCIDAVLIAVPHYDHPRYAIAALEAGLHVMCEKPAGVYTLQVREMIACADRHPGQLFAMMFNQRTNPLYRKMKQIIDSGELGQIRRTNWIITDWFRPEAYYRSGGWRATWSGEGGGVLLNQCPHQLDLWQWICGMPTKIDAKMKFGRWHNIEVEDDVTAYCEYANGATGCFITTTGDCPGSNRFEVTCEGGTLVCEGGNLTLRRLETPIGKFSATNTQPFGAPKYTTEQLEAPGENTQHVGVLNAFADAALHGGELVADGREGINGLLISNAMHLSAWTGSSVQLPFDEQLFYEQLKKRVAGSRRKTDIVQCVADTRGSY